MFIIQKFSNIKNRILILLLLFLLFHTEAFTQSNEETFKDYKIQAAYIYNFFDFVEWPETTEDTSDTITIGILGSDPFRDAFEPVEGTRVNGKVLVIKRSKEIQTLKSCHILFISSSEKKYAETIINDIKDLPILTVSDMENFTNIGGIIGFFVEKANKKNRIRFNISKGNADRTGIKISFKLLNLAKKEG